MERIKIERLPSVQPRVLSDKPSGSKDGAFSIGELEGLAERLRLWAAERKWGLPCLPFLSTAQFERDYSRMFHFEVYAGALEQLITALYPAGPHLFLVDPTEYCSIRFVPLRICPREENEWVYWPGELIPTAEWEGYAGYRGPLDEAAWASDPLRKQLEKELLVMTAFLFTRAAARLHYEARLFYTAPTWPLALRIR